MSELPSDLAIYSERSISADSQTIFAMKDCYLDYLSSGNIVAGAVVFKLNSFEIDRSSFKLVQELAMLTLTEARTDRQYTQALIIEPLEAAVALAGADADVAAEEVRVIKDEFKVGEYTLVDVAMAEARLDERRLILRKAEIDLGQKMLELDIQTRQVTAAREDLEKRLILNDKIRSIHEYYMPFSGSVTVHTYAGAFVEEGDPICTVHR